MATPVSIFAPPKPFIGTAKPASSKPDALVSTIRSRWDVAAQAVANLKAAKEQIVAEANKPGADREALRTKLQETTRILQAADASANYMASLVSDLANGADPNKVMGQYNEWAMSNKAPIVPPGTIPTNTGASELFEKVAGPDTRRIVRTEGKDGTRTYATENKGLLESTVNDQSFTGRAGTRMREAQGALPTMLEGVKGAADVGAGIVSHALGGVQALTAPVPQLVFSGLGATAEALSGGRVENPFTVNSTLPLSNREMDDNPDRGGAFLLKNPDRNTATRLLQNTANLVSMSDIFPAARALAVGRENKAIQAGRLTPSVVRTGDGDVMIPPEGMSKEQILTETTKHRNANIAMSVQGGLLHTDPSIASIKPTGGKSVLPGSNKEASGAMNPVALANTLPARTAARLFQAAWNIARGKGSATARDKELMQKLITQPDNPLMENWSMSLITPTRSAEKGGAEEASKMARFWSDNLSGIWNKPSKAKKNYEATISEITDAPAVGKQFVTGDELAQTTADALRVTRESASGMATDIKKAQKSLAGADAAIAKKGQAAEELAVRDNALYDEKVQQIRDGAADLQRKYDRLKERNTKKNVVRSLKNVGTKERGADQKLAADTRVGIKEQLEFPMDSGDMLRILREARDKGYISDSDSYMDSMFKPTSAEGIVHPTSIPQTAAALKALAQDLYKSTPPAGLSEDDALKWGRAREKWIKSNFRALQGIAIKTQRSKSAMLTSGNTARDAVPRMEGVDPSTQLRNIDAEAAEQRLFDLAERVDRQWRRADEMAQKVRTPANAAYEAESKAQANIISGIASNLQGALAGKDNTVVRELTNKLRTGLSGGASLDDIMRLVEQLRRVAPVGARGGQQLSEGERAIAQLYDSVRQLRDRKVKEFVAKKYPTDPAKQQEALARLREAEDRYYTIVNDKSEISQKYFPEGSYGTNRTEGDKLHQLKTIQRDYDMASARGSQSEFDLGMQSLQRLERVYDDMEGVVEGFPTLVRESGLGAVARRESDGTWSFAHAEAGGNSKIFRSMTDTGKPEPGALTTPNFNVGADFEGAGNLEKLSLTAKAGRIAAGPLRQAVVDALSGTPAIQGFANTLVQLIANPWGSRLFPQKGDFTGLQQMVRRWNHTWNNRVHFGKKPTLIPEKRGLLEGGVFGPWVTSGRNAAIRTAQNEADRERLGLDPGDETRPTDAMLVQFMESLSDKEIVEFTAELPKMLALYRGITAPVAAAVNTVASAVGSDYRMSGSRRQTPAELRTDAQGNPLWKRDTFGEAVDAGIKSADIYKATGGAAKSLADRARAGAENALADGAQVADETVSAVGGADAAAAINSLSEGSAGGDLDIGQAISDLEGGAMMNGPTTIGGFVLDSQKRFAKEYPGDPMFSLDHEGLKKYIAENPSAAYRRLADVHLIDRMGVGMDELENAWGKKLAFVAGRFSMGGPGFGAQEAGLWKRILLDGAAGETINAKKAGLVDKLRGMGSVDFLHQVPTIVTLLRKEGMEDAILRDALAEWEKIKLSDGGREADARKMRKMLGL